MAATHNNVEIESAMNGVLPVQYLAEIREKKELIEKHLQAVEVPSGMYFEYNGLLGPIHTSPKTEDAQLDDTSEETSHSTGEQTQVVGGDRDIAKQEQQEEETEGDSVYWDTESKGEFDPEASDDSDGEDYFSCVSSDSDPDELF